MVDVSLIAGAVSSLKTAGDLVRGLVDIRDGQMVQKQAIELQRLILDAQSSAVTAQSDQMGLIFKIKELEEKLASVEDWKIQAARYSLKDYGASTYAYELKNDLANGEPPHRACPKCFEARTRSILQFQYKDSSQRDHYRCHQCGSDYEFGHSVSHRSHVNRGSGWAV